MTRLFTKFAQSGRRGGFTLVEMLVVVVILAILVGIAVRILNAGKDQKEKAETQRRLAALKSAIEAFYSEYGHYPPVDSRYVFDDRVDYMIPDIISLREKGIGYVRNRRPIADTWGDRQYVFHIGLMGYLMPRFRCEIRDGLGYDLGVFASASDGGFGWQDLFENEQWRNYNRNRRGQGLIGNGPRDELAWERWRPFIQDIIVGPSEGELYHPPSGFRDRGHYAHAVFGQRTDEPDYFMMRFTVEDGWGTSFRYRSDPPHTTYRLWSVHGVEGHVGH